MLLPIRLIVYKWGTIRMDRNQLLNDNEEALRLSLDGRQSNIWTTLPAIVTKVNFAEMTVEVQPAIQGVVEKEDGSTEYVNLPLLADVPLVFPSAGGFIITLPVKAGDEVLVSISSRCIDAWWQNGGVNIPMEARMHDLSDGFAIPGPRSKPKVVSAISANALQIRNDAGDCYIEIDETGRVKIVSPTDMEITGNLVVSGEVTANGIPLSTHKHVGVQTGGGTSGGPVP